MLGCHIHKNKSPNYTDAVNDKIKDTSNTQSIKLGAVQLFAMGPRNWKENFSADDKVGLRKLADNGLHIYIHATYLDRPWDGKAAPINMIKKQLVICSEIGAKGLVVHLDRRTPTTIATELKKIAKDIPKGVRIYLEINAAKGDMLYSTPAALNELFAEFKKQNMPNMSQIGLCIDTAHLWSCGARTVTGDEMCQWLDSLSGDIGPILVHLNDNQNPFGSGKDHHGALAQHQIWSEYHPTKGTKDITDSGLLVIISWAAESNIDIILERKEGLDDDFKLLHDLGYYTV